MMSEPKRRIVAIVDDLIFASRIRAVAAVVGSEVVFLKNSNLEALPNNSPVSLVIVDLQAQAAQLSDLMKSLRENAQTHDAPVIGFFSHVQMQLKRDAEAAGLTRVLPRSAFTAKLAEILQGNF